MTPDEAEGFREEDEDPQEIFGRLGTGRQVAEMRGYIRDRYAGRDEAPGWYARGGVIPNDPGPHGDGVPLPLTGGCFPGLPPVIQHDRFQCGPLAGVPIPEPHGVALRDDSLADELARAWRKEWDRRVRGGRLVTYPPLSRRTCLRLAIARIRDRAAIWLVDHGHHDAALWLWRDRRRR